MNSATLLKEKLSGSVTICKLHIKRLNYAINSLFNRIPDLFEIFNRVEQIIAKYNLSPV